MLCTRLCRHNYKIGYTLILLHYFAGDLFVSMNTVSDETISLLEQRDLAGRTALMLASSEGHINLLELFLDKGSSLETKDKEGLTALGWACVRGRLTAVQMLLDRGSNVNTNDNSGRTPLDLAAFQVGLSLVCTTHVLCRVLLS